MPVNQKTKHNNSVEALDAGWLGYKRTTSETQTKQQGGIVQISVSTRKEAWILKVAVSLHAINETAEWENPHIVPENYIKGAKRAREELLNNKKVVSFRRKGSVIKIIVIISGMLQAILETSKNKIKGQSFETLTQKIRHNPILAWEVLSYLRHSCSFK